MKANFYNLIWIIFVLLALAWLLTGCSFLQKPESTFQPETAKQLLFSTTQKTNAPIWLCVFIAAGGAVALFNGVVKLGFSSIIFGSTSLALGLATSRFGFWIAIMGLVGTASAIAYSILVKNIAIKDIVTGIELFKKTYRGKEDVITDAAKAIDSCQAAMQVTNTTKQIVQRVKADLKIKGKME